MALRDIPRAPLIALGLILLMAIPSFAEFYTDWLWFEEVGYTGVYLKSITARSAMGSVVFLVAGAFLAFNLFVALSAVPLRNIVVVTPEGPRTISLQPRRLRPVVWLVSGLLALLMAGYASTGWSSYLAYRQAVPFGQVDPVLGRDVSFYLFQWPFLSLAQQLFFLIALLAVVATAAAYALAGNLGLRIGRGMFITESTRRHLSILVGLLLLALALGDWLEIPQQLFEPSGIITGASYTDVHARIPALRVLALVGVAGALLALVQAFSVRLWPIALAVGGYVAVSIGGTVYATIVQRVYVAPNEQVRETPFIQHNITATREAFGLNAVEERQLSGDATLTRADLDRNADTIDNVPLWDHQPLLDTFSQIQEIRTYYDFVSVDNDRYTINGRRRQIMLSARELNSESLPNRTWINEQLTFTHGYGLTLGPVNEVTPEGLPILFIKDLPPQSVVDLKVTEPSIYFGELSNDHVFVKTRTKEFHYPSGEDNVFAEYEGRGGVPVGSFFRKLLFAIRFGSGKALLSDDLRPDSRVLYYRRISERVRKIAPFLTYDQDPYVAIADGRLYWIQDAYTTSNRYPYSSAIAGGTNSSITNQSINYIRNSIKVVIDAYHGTTHFYLVDPSDPLAQTYARIFPGLLKPLSDMPASLRQRLRYPQDIFSVQASMFATYHMQSPSVFYNKEDQWEVPSIDVGEQPVRMEPYYTMMKVPGEKGTEFIQMLPFTPRQKDNLAAWMIARSDGPHYGRLAVFQFPKQKVVFGPRQVVARINQDQAIAPQITLWNQQGSEVIQGTLLVIPIEESLIYVRPLYLRASNGQIPELNRVIVAYKDGIVMAETLTEALDRLFPADGTAPKLTSSEEAAALAAALVMNNPAAPADAKPGTAGQAATTTADPTRPTAAGTPQTRPSTPNGTLTQRAEFHYRQALERQRLGDWAGYGEEIRALGLVLEEMRRAEQQKAPR
ncbi:UPF0182 protein [Luteitalea sp. TBR-22]|uniref:UPF0182 family membrane protein n=1 Tax=Luteitalea sp. TBR-22 TaxID=2802971 RepID=UPI001AFA1E49|nr:UPF0182 family protein [Luteitalea sp. TBR-22]BCS35989.1 UPF0182 protein [Luteitalea sp. TBR-22]